MDFRYVALIALFVVLGLLSTAVFLHRRVRRSGTASANLAAAETASQQLSLDFNPYTTAGVDKQSIPSERVTL